MPQTTNTIVMVRPHEFFSNTQTSTSNSFQADGDEDVTVPAHHEFNAMVKTLSDYGVTVNVFDGPKGSPDSIFPNNTFSTHVSKKGHGIFVSYPMQAPNRQSELTDESKARLSKKYSLILDLKTWHAQGKYLEGTGSLVLDRQNDVAYALRSSRTDIDLAEAWAERLHYDLVTFDAHDEEGEPIYHTNVFMSVGTSFAVITPEVMPDQEEAQLLKASLKATGHEIIEITRAQMNAFCGNILEIKNNKDESLLVMSTTAHAAFNQRQLDTFSQHVDHIVPIDIPTIEKYGGGGVRCMIAEIFTP